MEMKRNSIQQKIMSAVLFTCTVALLLMCGAFLLFEYQSYKKTVKNNISALAAVVASNSSAALAFQSRSDALDILNALRNNPHISVAGLYDNSGRLFAVYPKNISSRQLPSKPRQDGYRFLNGFLEEYQPVLQGKSRLGTLYIQSDMKEIYTQLASFILVAGLLFTGSLFVAYLISFLLQRRITKPIRLLEKTANAISGNRDYSIRAVKTGEDEIGSLTDAFNQMLSQLELQNEAILEAAAETNKLAAIVESSNDAIISMSLDGFITSWNYSAYLTFGYTAEEAIGQSVFIIIPEDRQQEEVDILERLRNGERIKQFETQRKTKDKKVLEISISISSVKDSRGIIIGSSKIARDISERKQVERRKNDFIGMVSHELKTPLTSVRSYVQMLLLEAKKRNSDGFIINALTRTDVQTKKMAHMIQDFLNLARLEDGKVQIQKQVFDLDDLINETAGDAQLFTSNHKIKTELSSGISVLADRDKIGQVLMNLLTNAIKYSPKGGDITISCSVQNESVEIWVTDQGIGISPADQRKLFQRFYRVEGEQMGTISGFGIGLYLVSEILRYHDTEILVESREGAGSSFHFNLKISGR
jgi:two-component system, OmpR family, sensor histidine kinase VicK